MPDEEQRSTALQQRNVSAARQRRQERLAAVDLDEVSIYPSLDVHRLPLSKSGKYWIEIKAELDFGEQTVLDNASVIGLQRANDESAGGSDQAQTVRLDMPRHRFLLCATWLTDWRIPPDEDGKPIKLPRNINERVMLLKRLNAKWGDAIVEAITDYVAEITEVEEAAQRAADEEAGIDSEGGEPVDPPDHSQNGESDGGE